MNPFVRRETRRLRLLRARRGGSPPCHATVIFGVRCDSSNCRMYVSSVSSDIRCLSLGYSASFDRKKQYLQSMLQVDPLGFANRWNPGGELVGDVFSAISDIRAPSLIILRLGGT